MLSTSQLLLLLLTSTVSANKIESYIDRCYTESDPTNWVKPWELPDPGDPTDGPNSYSGNALSFKNNNLENGVPGYGCTPFKILSDWNDTLTESGDTISGKIKGGDTSDPSRVGEPYEGVGFVLNDLVCADYDYPATTTKMQTFDRYLTVLTANPLSGKSSWSGKDEKIKAVHVQGFLGER